MFIHKSPPLSLSLSLRRRNSIIGNKFNFHLTCIQYINSFCTRNNNHLIDHFSEIHMYTCITNIFILFIKDIYSIFLLWNVPKTVFLISFIIQKQLDTSFKHYDNLLLFYFFKTYVLHVNGNMMQIDASDKRTIDRHHSLNFKQYMSKTRRK